MSEQLKTDFARAQKFIKAEQYAQAITILQPHKEHPRIAALIDDLEAKRKPKGGIWITAIWVTVVIIVAVIAGAAGYALGESRTSSQYEMPSAMELTFVELCVVNTDVSATDCMELIQHDWIYYRADTVACYGLIQDVADLTNEQFLECIAAIWDS